MIWEKEIGNRKGEKLQIIPMGPEDPRELKKDLRLKRK